VSGGGGADVVEAGGGVGEGGERAQAADGRGGGGLGAAGCRASRHRQGEEKG
jgi:hypothetical protein